MAELKNSKVPKDSKGMKLHQFIARGGKPKNFKGSIGIEHAKGTKNNKK